MSAWRCPQKRNPPGCDLPDAQFLRSHVRRVPSTPHAMSSRDVDGSFVACSGAARPWAEVLPNGTAVAVTALTATLLLEDVG